MRFEGAEVEGLPGAVIILDNPADGAEMEIRLTGHQIAHLLTLAERVADDIRRRQNERWG